MITGASTGIGATCALHLDSLGFRVFAGIRKPADADAIRGKASSRLMPVSLDVTDAESIAAAVRTVADAVGAAGLQGLVNNAGFALAGPIELLPIAELRKQLEVNVIGLVATTQAFLPLLRRGRGRIVNMGSITGRLAMPLLGAYSASKFAVEALTDSLRLEVEPWGIGVAVIEPGGIATPIWEKAQAAGLELKRRATPDGLRLYAAAIAAVEKASERAVRRAIPPEVVARVVLHALTAPRPKTRYIVGRDARIRAVMAKLLPDRTRDRVLARILRLPKRAEHGQSPS